MQIISVPTVFTCKLPTAGWLNLAQMRQVQVEEEVFNQPVVMITWQNGDNQVFHGENAKAIITALSEASTRQLQHLQP
jgi:hypothetical protein